MLFIFNRPLISLIYTLLSFINIRFFFCSAAYFRWTNLWWLWLYCCFAICWYLYAITITLLIDSETTNKHSQRRRKKTHSSNFVHSRFSSVLWVFLRVFHFLVLIIYVELPYGSIYSLCLIFVWRLFCLFIGIAVFPLVHSPLTTRSYLW